MIQCTPSVLPNSAARLLFHYYCETLVTIDVDVLIIPTSDSAAICTDVVSTRNFVTVRKPVARRTSFHPLLRISLGWVGILSFRIPSRSSILSRLNSRIMVLNGDGRSGPVLG